MAKENLMLLVNGADNDMSFVISSEFNSTYQRIALSVKKRRICCGQN